MEAAAAFSSLLESLEASLGDMGMGCMAELGVGFVLCFRARESFVGGGDGSPKMGARGGSCGAAALSSFSISSKGARGFVAGGGSCCDWAAVYSRVFFRIMRRGQFILSWLQPLAHPPQRRAGIVGDEVRPACPPEVRGVDLLDVDGEAFDAFSCAVRRLSSDHVRNSFWRIYLPLLSLRFMTINSQWLTLRRSSKYSTDQWYLGGVSLTQALCRTAVACSPLHEKNSRHQAMCDQDAHAGKVVIAKGSPQALIEATDSVVGIGRALPIRDAVEEVAVVCPLLPHALHFEGAWLEVAKVLLAQPRFFENGDFVAWEGRGRGVV